MSSICGVCSTEKKYDIDRGMYKRCALCNSKKVLKYYYNNKDIVLAKHKNYYQNNKKRFREYNRKRVIKISDLQNQINQLTGMLQTSAIVS